MRLLKTAIAAAFLLSTSACGILPTDTPQDKLNAAKFAFATTAAVYDAICIGATPPPACHDPKAIAAEQAVKDLANNAFAAAQASIDAGKPDAPALVAAAITAVPIIENLLAALRNQPPSSS